jgi:hypothetical protein
MSLLEFGHQSGWGDKMATIAPLCVFNKQSKDERDPNKVLKLFTDDFEQLARGVDMFCESENKVVRVFGYVTVILGDGPGRCELVGTKKGALSKLNCHTCEARKDDLVKDFSREDYIQPRTRKPHEFRQVAKALGEDKAAIARNPKLSILSKDTGITHYSEVLNYPGVEVPLTVTNDIMHCELQGEAQKHFLKFMRIFQKYDKDCWRKFSEKLIEIQNANNVKRTPKFHNEKSWL